MGRLYTRRPEREDPCPNRRTLRPTITTPRSTPCRSKHCAKTRPAPRSSSSSFRRCSPGSSKFSDVERLHSDGRLRDGEPDTLRSILDVVDSAPEYFKVLADKDYGNDPKRFETDVLRERLDRREILTGVANEIGPLSAQISDHVLHLGELTRPPILAAYHIGKPLSEHDAQLGSKMSTAKSFYSRAARRAADTRKKNEAAKNDAAKPAKA
jgi:hypothetical protein